MADTELEPLGDDALVPFDDDALVQGDDALVPLGADDLVPWVRRINYIDSGQVSRLLPDGFGNAAYTAAHGSSVPHPYDEASHRGDCGA